jgi:RNA polymerase sigma-70 factor (ECF subfamily)
MAAGSDAELANVLLAAAGTTGDAGELPELLERAERRWPMLPADRPAFAAYLGKHRPRESSIEEYLAQVHVEDLFLAFACRRGNPEAHAMLDALYLSGVEKELARKSWLAPLASDAIHQLRDRLLVGDPSGPKLEQYAGTGPLLALVRAAALRIAINLRRQRLPSEKQAPVDEAVLLSPDPEIEFLKTHYREHFGTAFREALAGLPDEQLNVLRLRLVDGLNIDAIGVMYGAHRATVARWIATTRRTLLDQTRARLAARLRIDQDELDSVMRLVRSRLDASIRSLLSRPP